MATGQTLLDTLEVLLPELQNQPGEADVTRSLIALNRAQDHFEALIVQYPEILGDNVTTISTTASTETTTFPSGFLRLDSMWALNATTGYPDYELDNPDGSGSHRVSNNWPFYTLVAQTSVGRPTAFWTNGRLIYWDPIPDAVYTLRVYGFSVATDLTVAGTFLYPDIAILALAGFAARIMKSGLDDDPTQIALMANEVFQPVIEALSNFNRTGPVGRTYRYIHST